MKKPILRIILLSFTVYFFSWLFVSKLGVNQLPIQSEDTVPSLFLPVAIIRDHTLYLDSFYSQMIERYPHPDDKDQVRGLTPYYLRKIETGSGFHYVSAFPVMVGFLAVPVYILPLLLGLATTIENLTVLAHITSAIIVALSGGLFFVFLERYLKVARKSAELLTLVYLFGTVNFAMLSQGLWQHGVVELFTILALISVYKKNSFLLGVFLGLAALTRPTAVLLIPFLLLLLLLLVGVKRLVPAVTKFAAGLALPALLFYWYTSTYYLGISNNGYSDQLLTGWRYSFPEGFLGMWLSPSKGILIYTPVFIFSLFGLYLAVKKRVLQYAVFGIIVLVHTLILSFWKHWYGGYGFGYRMASDVIPFLVLLLIPYLESSYFQRMKKLFFVAVILSVLIQISGIVFFDGIWHAAYDNGFENTGWLWSLRDSEFAFNARRVLVKFGVLERACPNCL